MDNAASHNISTFLPVSQAQRTRIKSCLSLVRHIELIKKVVNTFFHGTRLYYCEMENRILDHPAAVH